MKLRPAILGRLKNRVAGAARRDEGSNLVEMAMVVGVFLTILIGTIEFSLILYAFNCVTDASRVTARWAAVRGATSCTNTPSLTDCNATTAQIQTYAQGLGYPMVAATMTVSTTWLSASATTPTSWSACGTTNACKAVGNQVQVTVSYPITTLFPFLSGMKGWLSSRTWTLSSTATMVVSQ